MCRTSDLLMAISFNDVFYSINAIVIMEKLLSVNEICLESNEELMLGGQNRSNEFFLLFIFHWRGLSTSFEFDKSRQTRQITAWRRCT